eukprot:CAMPEP_0175011952 /NCGR_PEP_ID=MMETSP0005-20121125/9008_1 /TAXON_ID=420556 /ORGANISM="Ochromonas sp., Strain CCMP1393" /LENGTH=290 /DNA_ID=CAMNT_0016268073 /DNA_START=125 /DNA_END=997 /DNA_ORIENTATION=+
MESKFVITSKLVSRMSNADEDDTTAKKSAPQGSVYFGEDYERPGLFKLSEIDLQRFITYNGLALLLALGANFVGITSTLMSTNPAYFRSLGLDQLYSIDGYRRYADTEDKYEFMFPADWVMDQTIVNANARDRELPQALRMRKQQSASLIGPDVAMGPIQGDGRENLSVIKSRVMPGFVMQRVLGTPQAAAEKLLSTVIAPPDSGKTYELIKAEGREKNGKTQYTFEYTIRNDEKKLFQHTVSVITNRGTELFTFTATIPQSKWDTLKAQILTSADSFDVKGQDLPVGFY